MKSSSLAFLGVRGKSISCAFRTGGARGEGWGWSPLYSVPGDVSLDRVLVLISLS